MLRVPDISDLGSAADAGLWPLAVFFGSYRGRGQVILERVCKHLREKHFRAFTVAELSTRRDWRGTSLENSLRCIEACDLAVFIFLSAKTLGTDENLEGVDQGMMIEFTYLYCLDNLRTGHITRRPCKLIFDSDERYASVSSLLKAVMRQVGQSEYFAPFSAPSGSISDTVQAIENEAFRFCKDQYVRWLSLTHPDMKDLLRTLLGL